MRFLRIFIITFLLGLSVAASNNRSLEWYKAVSTESYLSGFTGSILSEDGVLPLYSETYLPEIQAEAYNVSITFPIFEKLTSKELNYLKPYLKNFPDTIRLNVSSGMQKKKKLLDLSFVPFIRKGNSYYRLSSFKWSISPVGTALRSGAALNSNTAYSSSSVLASGKWKKISVTESGLYRLTWQEIKDMGINPENVQIYGYGGALLEEDFSKAVYSDDLPEVAIWKNPGSDGVFNSGDFILFYAQGPVSWVKNASTGMYTRIRNHYSDKAYYFVGEREGGSKTASSSTFSGTPNKKVTSFTDFLLHENDWVNIGESVSSSGTGRELYGEDFVTSPSQIFSFSVPGVDLTHNSKIYTEFASHNTLIQYCGISVDRKSVATMSLSPISVSNSYTYATSSTNTSLFLPSSETISVRLDYTKNGNSPYPRAYLNYIALNVRKSLKFQGSSFVFRDPESVGTGNVARYTIQNANSSIIVLDVTDPAGMTVVNGSLNGTEYVFDAQASSLHEYVCVDLSGSFSKPTIEGSVPNQNIHGCQQVDMVIIVPADFISQARRLAEAHVSKDGMSVLVVTPEQVYNEFSSGTPDATAYRRMMKLFYDRAATEDALPKYLLLFGGGIYDNRMVSAKALNSSSKSNRILTYQSKESLEGTMSYVTDDYFGFLDDSEGKNLSIDKLDIGIGRFPVHSLEQARNVVDKTLSYMENSKKGSWKNRLLYLADDGDDNVHMDQAETIASSVETAHPEFMVNRIYVDAYKKVTSASGTTTPDANTGFSELLNSGLLMLNYTGHGSTTEWTEEKILTLPEINAMTNKCLPLWVTATCDFTRYDALETSGGEYVFLNPYGGGVAMFTTTRIVYSSNNFIINKCFTDNIFSKKNGVRNSLGEIMHLTKSSENLKYDRNKLSFALIGDPALKLAYPEYKVKVTKVNGHNDITAVVDTFQALSKVTVSGEIYQEDGNFADDFNGLIFPTVLDSKSLVKTLGSNGADIFSYYDRSRVLFTGKDSVINGKFSFTFVVPKDISYLYERGNINFYAYDKTNEANGYYDNFVLGGTDATALEDTTGPDINLYLNDTDFVSGGSVNETPTLIAMISDDSGLNTSGNGIGHDLQVVIDEDPDMTYTLNNYYIASIGSFNSGTVQFVLPDISAGKHSLQFRAWDVRNNSSTQTLAFKVVSGLAPSLSDLRYVQQNDCVLFRFTHNRPEVSSTVQLTVYDILGRSLWSSTKKMQTGEIVSEEFEWDMVGTNGVRVQDGIYICKVIVTDSNGASSIISVKLHLLLQ